MAPPQTSIIVCVHNRAEQIAACLESLAASSFRDYELVLVDDASTDHTPLRLAAFRQTHPELQVTIVRNERNRGVSGARNAGIEAARGEFILFTDSDCTVDSNWIGELVADLALPGVVAASGTVIDPRPRNWAEEAYFGTTRIGAARWQGRDLVGNNMGFRADLLAAHRFDEAMVYGCDEDDLAVRLRRSGGRFAFVPSAVVYHHHPMTLRSYLNMAARQGAGAARFWYKHNRWLGRDLWPLAAAALTLPLAALDVRWLAVTAAALLMQVAALVYNEMALKGKTLGTALYVLPVGLLYYAWRVAAIVKTWARLACGGEQPIRVSKRIWRQQSLHTPRAAAPVERREAA